MYAFLPHLAIQACLRDYFVIKIPLYLLLIKVQNEVDDILEPESHYVLHKKTFSHFGYCALRWIKVYSFFTVLSAFEIYAATWNNSNYQSEFI